MYKLKKWFGDDSSESDSLITMTIPLGGEEQSPERNKTGSRKLNKQKKE